MGRYLELSPRLRLLADWVPQGVSFADIGTDHGYLPVWLRLHGRVRCAIACDLRQGPLERARATGQFYGADGIDYRLADGLAALRPEEAEYIAIAGMGGENIISILNAAPWTADGHHTLLLMPHTKAYELRAYLASHGFSILREKLVRERGTLYPAMMVTAGEMTLSDAQCLAGAGLLHDPLGERYIIEQIIRLQMALAGAKQSRRPGEQQKAEHLRESLKALLEWREEWRHANCP